MGIPEFSKPTHTKRELREVSRRTESGQEKQVRLVSWIKELRKMKKLDPEKAKDYVPPADLLKRFYKETEAAYEELPLSKEEIESEFSEENLARLSLPEYVDLLRRVPPRFVTHVTRQGIRDHISHNAGDQDVFSQGFEKILEKGKIQSILEQFLEGVIDKETVRAVLEDHLHIPEDYPTIEAARSRLDDFLNRSTATNLASSEIADMRALHVAMDYVADTFYGGESANEIFFVYPTAHIASQNNVARQYMEFPKGLKLSEISKTSQFNDFWLKSKAEGKGELTVDASIVFIPENTPVDPDTGSKYATDSEKKPIPNLDQMEKLKKMVASPECKQLWPQIYREIGNYRDQLGKVEVQEEELTDMLARKADEFDTDKKREQILDAKQKVVAQKVVIEPLINLMRNFGVTDSRLYGIFESNDNTAWQAFDRFLDRSVKDEPFKNDEMDKIRLEDQFRQLGIQYRLAEKTIPSKQYWEQYFTRTGRRPSKVVYYEQATPNNALRAFKERAGLAEEGPHQQTDLKEMFRENLIGNKEMHSQMERERQLFLLYAEELLDEQYKK